VRGRGAARRLVRRRKRCGRLERTRKLAHVERIDQHAAVRRDELGRAADPGGDDALATGERLEERLPERLDQRGAADDVGGAHPPGHVLVRHAPDDTNAGSALELGPQRPVADERQRPASEERERIGQPDDVLARCQRPDVQERGLLELR